jgi:segregation and condensation protein A
MKVHYKLESFEGPLDLLLHLIEKAEVDIYNIPIHVITDQYMEYVGTMQELELEVASEFLVMAATLLSIKSKMLLPKPPVLDLPTEEDEDLDPRMELVQKLLEYRKYKSAAEELRSKELERSLIYTRAPEDLSPYIRDHEENPLGALHVADLVMAFQKLLRRVKSRNIVTRIQRDEISVKDRIREVVSVLKARGGRVMFSRLLDEEFTRQDIVVTFLALLELMKMKQVSCFQDRLFDDIVILARGDTEPNGLSDDEIDY